MPGELWVDTFNNGNFYPDSDEDENERSQDNSGLPMVMGLALAGFLGIALGPVTAVAVGATEVIASIAGLWNPP